MRAVLLKRLAVAFAAALALHAIVSFGEPLFPKVMRAFGGAFGTVLVPAGIFMIVLYRSAFLTELSSPGVQRVTRLFVCLGCSFGLAIASMLVFLLLWFAVCWMFGLPFRNA
jgi:hypothetical protein